MDTKMNEASAVFLLLASIFISDATEISRTHCRENLGAEASRRFAYDLYTKAVQEKGGKENIFLAPTTVSSALGMILLGANGTTRERLRQGLKLISTSQNFTEDDYPCLLRSYNTGNESLVLRSAHRLFGEKTFDFDNNFLQKTSLFGANLEEVDFANAPQLSRKKINGWVSDVTEKKIPHLFGKDDITSSTVLAITSAIYFKGLWQKSFDPNLERMSFYNGKERIRTRFMRRVGLFKNTNRAELGASLLELPYKSGGGYEVSMIIILPYKRSSIQEVEAKLSDEMLRPAIRNLLEETVPFKLNVLLPKFKIHGDYDLQPLLTNMGMGEIFDQSTADLSGMRNRTSSDTRSLYVGSAIHKTFIKVDQKGTEAAGATGILLMARSHLSFFTCNRPFISIVYEKTTDRILFIGKVVNPKKK